MNDHRHARTLLLLFLLGLASACGGLNPQRTGDTIASPQPTGTPFDHPPVDWDRPLIDGVQVSMNAAANDLSFTPAYPGGVGAPSKIEVSDPSGLEPNQRALGLVYQDPSYGRFWVIEEVSETTESWLKGLASCDHSSGCEGSWSLVTLKDGTTAVDFAGSTNGVLWLYNGVRYDVFGPPATFSTDDALAVANATEAAAASSSSPSSG